MSKKAMESELFQLAQSNGLAMIELMARAYNAEQMIAEFRQALDREIPGEVWAWAKAFPAVIAQKTEDAAVVGGITAQCARVGAYLLHGRMLPNGPSIAEIADGAEYAQAVQP